MTNGTTNGGTSMTVNMDVVRLITQAVVAIGVLAGATFLAISNHITSDAVVGLYGTAIGAVGAGAVGGYRAGQNVQAHHHAASDVEPT